MVLGVLLVPSHPLDINNFGALSRTGRLFLWGVSEERAVISSSQLPIQCSLWKSDSMWEKSLEGVADQCRCRVWTGNPSPCPIHSPVTLYVHVFVRALALAHSMASHIENGRVPQTLDQSSQRWVCCTISLQHVKGWFLPLIAVMLIGGALKSAIPK